MTLDGRANVCSVQFNPECAHLLAISTAGSKVRAAAGHRLS